MRRSAATSFQKLVPRTVNSGSAPGVATRLQAIDESTTPRAVPTLGLLRGRGSELIRVWDPGCLSVVPPTPGDSRAGTYGPRRKGVKRFVRIGPPGGAPPASDFPYK
jgi:hypothetical protein